MWITTPLLPSVTKDTSPQDLAVLARGAPLLIPQADLPSVLPLLPSRTARIVALGPNATLDDAANILDAGAEAVVTASSEIIEAFAGERIILSVSAETALPVAELAGKVAGAVLQLPAGIELTSAQAGDIVARFAEVFAVKATGKSLFVVPHPDSASSQVADVKLLVSTYGASLVVPAKQLSISSSPNTLDFASGLFAPLVSDRADGLFPTVVVNASGISLGLVYSSLDSLRASLAEGRGIYQSRTRGLWRKGDSSGATQQLVRIKIDCDTDAIEFTVRQQPGKNGEGFCHFSERAACFGKLEGLSGLEETLKSRLSQAPEGSYTQRLFRDPILLGAKIREEAQELVDAKDEDKQHVAFEMADLLYFSLARCIKAGVSIEDVEAALDGKARKVTRRKGDAKAAFLTNGSPAAVNGVKAASAPAPPPVVAPAAAADAPIRMASYRLEALSPEQRTALLARPSIKGEAIQDIARPILKAVKERGDAALLELTAKFDRAILKTPVIHPPFATAEVMKKIKPEVKEAIDVAYGNIWRFHAAQKQTSGNVSAAQAGVSGFTGPSEDAKDAVLEMETLGGVVCRRFARPIQRVGLYVPGGTAVLPSTALMLGVPAQVARCPTVVLATPPRPDGSIAPEVLYVAEKVKATCILAAGGAQAVAAMAYGTQTVPKVDKIVGPGNQFVTAAKMLVQNETDALVSIDMPAGPSEVLVIADTSSDPRFVASDLLSQAEHGPDSMVVLVAIALSDAQVKAIEVELDAQANRLPRVETVRKAIEKSVTIIVPDREAAMAWSNAYAPEHLILQTERPEELVALVENAGSVFVGQWSPESCGDYASGTNHTLPTYGFARQYSGVSTSTFEKHITSQSLTAEGLALLGPHVVHLAECEGLEAHAEAVRVRLQVISAGKV